VTETAVFKLLKLYRLHCMASFKPEDDDDTYRAVISDCRLAPDDETLFDWFEAFKRRNVGERYVRWGRFAAYLRDRAGPKKHRGPAAGPCAFCGDTGYMTIAAPHAQDGRGLVPDAADFEPPLPYHRAELYAVAIPCLCSRGRKIERKQNLSPAWQALRAKWVRVWAQRGFSPLLVTRCIRESHAARRRAFEQASAKARPAVLVGEERAGGADAPRETDNIQPAGRQALPTS